MNRLVIPRELQDRLIENMAAIAILTFIKENEKDRIGISKDRVARYMNEREICSRPTTLKIIDSLMQAGILLDLKRGRKNSNDLVVHKEFPFEEIMQQSFRGFLKKVEKNMKPFQGLIDKGVLKGVRKSNRGNQIVLDVD